jgi:hypothetical protein
LSVVAPFDAKANERDGEKNNIRAQQGVGAKKITILRHFDLVQIQMTHRC